MNNVKTVGFVISSKENEHRRGLLPVDIGKLAYQSELYFEKNYGEVMQISDKDYQALGCHIVSREEALSQQIVSDPKIGDADYLEQLQPGQTIFGWIHAEANPERLALLQRNKLTSYEWANMYKKGRHSFWRNNQLAGGAAIIDAFRLVGKLPKNKKVAVIGRGNVAQGAIELLNQLGANVTVFNRQQEDLFREELPMYDVVVNGTLWDRSRQDHLIYQEDLKRLKNGTLLIDVSCDEHGAIESSIPTTMKEPIYTIDGVIHYAVDHTPSIFFQESSQSISTVVATYLDDLMSGKPNQVLEEALITREGQPASH